jgi:sn-glycerol 3-phosphate transport system permease protein
MIKGIKQKNRSRLWATLILLIPAALQFFPLLYVLALSFMKKTEVFKYPPELIPEQLQLGNYVAALDTAPLGRFLLNSLITASAITVLQLVTGLLAAYALARLEFRGRALAFGLILGTMMVPGEITIIPNYLTIARLDWIDTYYALILPFSASGFGIFLLYQFIRTIPKELEEAAFLDGASRLRFLFQFVVPLSTPALVSFGVYAFVNAWNQYLWPLVVTQSTNMQTAQIGIGMFRAQNESESWGVIMAATMILISPTIALFIATQRQFISGMTNSGIKG